MMYIWPTWVTEWPCLGLTWGQIVTLTFEGQTIHGSTRLTRQTRYQNCCCTFKIKDFIVQNRLGKFGILTPVTSILTWVKKWAKWFRNDFRELTNAVFRFVLRCAGAEIDGGGVFKPPHQVWKIQRPSRARVNLRQFNLTASFDCTSDLMNVASPENTHT